MTFQQKVKSIGDALAAINGLNVFHYWRFGVTAPYCIWAEDGDVSLEGDNHKEEQGVAGAVHLFTKTEYDPLFDEIQDALNGIENVRWYYDDSDFEDETRLIHHSWRWTIL